MPICSEGKPGHLPLQDLLGSKPTTEGPRPYPEHCSRRPTPAANTRQKQAETAEHSSGIQCRHLVSPQDYSKQLLDDIHKQKTKSVIHPQRMNHTLTAISSFKKCRPVRRAFSAVPVRVKAPLWQAGTPAVPEPPTCIR